MTNPDWISSSWKPRLVNTPVPIMLAMTTARAVRALKGAEINGQAIRELG